MASNSSRKIPYGTSLLLLALAAALLSVAVLQKHREKRVLGILLQDQELELITVQHLLQKEKEHSREMKSRLNDLKEKTISLITEKTELNDKLMETETTVNNLNMMKQEMEAALQEKENQINRLTEKAAESSILNLQVDGLNTLLKQKDTEIDEMKNQLNLAHENVAEDNAGLNYSKGNESPHNDSPEKPTLLNKEVEVKSVNETANAHEGTEEVKWVGFRTNIENDESKDQSESNSDQVRSDFSKENQIEKLEISEENEVPTKEAGNENMVDSNEQKDLKYVHLADPTGEKKDTRTEWTSSDDEQMQLHKDGDSEKLDESRVLDEQKMSSDLNSSEKTNHTKTKVKHGKKIKRRRQRHYDVLKTERISENQMTSGNLESSTVKDDKKGAGVYSDQPQTTGAGGSQNSN